VGKAACRFKEGSWRSLRISFHSRVEALTYQLCADTSHVSG
jgi:hypothetical protein